MELTCHCGKTFKNTRYPGGPRKFGRRQKYCTDRCNNIAKMCRARGITTEQYWEVQKKGCAICGGFDCNAGRKIHLDHNHQNGKFRGGLCSSCNTGLGMFQDSPELIKKALDYITTS